MSHESLGAALLQENYATVSTACLCVCIDMLKYACVCVCVCVCVYFKEGIRDRQRDNKTSTGQRVHEVRDELASAVCACVFAKLRVCKCV